MYPPPAPRGAVVQCYPRSARAARPSSSLPSSPKPGQRRGITFPLSSGHFTLAWVPPSIPEPREPSLLPGLAGIRGVREGPARSLREPRGQRRPRLPPASSSYERVAEPGCGWPRLLCAYRAQALPMPWSLGLLWALLCTAPPNGVLCVRARVPLLSPLCRLSERGLLGLIGIRNPFNLQRSKLTSARVLGEVGEGRPGRGFQANRKH